MTIFVCVGGRFPESVWINLREPSSSPSSFPWFSKRRPPKNAKKKRLVAPPSLPLPRQKTKKIALCFFVRAAVLQKKKRRIIRSFSCFSSLLPFPSSATFSSQRRGRRRTKETKAPNTLSERCVVFPVGLGRRRAESFFEFLHGSEREVVVLRFLLGAT